jgi:hypothetical protein
MKHVYIVTRIVEKLTNGIREIPNLGVHTSFKKALQHYNSVIVDRGANSVWNIENFNDPITSERTTLLATFWSVDHQEEVRLEKWKVK